MLLLTSANGNQARPLLPSLAKAGVHVRALRKTPGGEAELLSAGAAQVTIGDMADPAAARRSTPFCWNGRGVRSVDIGANTSGPDAAPVAQTGDGER
jgi:hypothetical protein